MISKFRKNIENENHVIGFRFLTVREKKEVKLDFWQQKYATWDFQQNLSKEEVVDINVLIHSWVSNYRYLFTDLTRIIVCSEVLRWEYSPLVDPGHRRQQHSGSEWAFGYEALIVVNKVNSWSVGRYTYQI